MAKRIIQVALCAALMAGMATASLAQGDAVAKRQAGMKSLVPALNAVNTAAKGGDFATAEAKAKELAGTVHAFHDQFPAGSGPDTGAKTRAKAEIWSDAAGFKAALDKAGSAADGVVAAAASKDAEKVDASVKAFQGTCGACHTAFRGPPVA